MDKLTEIFDNGKKINVIKDVAVKTIGKEETDNDIYAYGYLNGIRFTRTETIGTGGSKCNFWLVRDK